MYKFRQFVVRIDLYEMLEFKNKYAVIDYNCDHINFSFLNRFVLLKMSTNTFDLH